MSPRVERIAQMEHRLRRATEATAILESALEQWQSVQADFEALDDYLGSQLWHSDREADTAGLLPDDLLRGVLSEDAIWNLLERRRHLLAHSLGSAAQQD